MSQPKIINTLTGYQFDWLIEQVQINVSRIHQTRASTAGEILIKTSAPGIEYPHLKQISFSFTSNEARRMLARELTERLAVDWTAILEQLCVYVLRAVRQGEPVMELGTSKFELHPPEYYLHPLIIKNYPTIIFGEPGAAKSTFALFCALAMTLPFPENELGLIMPSEPKTILYLDWETDSETIDWQFRGLQRGLDVTDAVRLCYRRCWQPLAHDVEQIKQAIDDYKADITIIDSLGYAAGGDINSPESPLTFWSGWRQLKTTSLILAHTSKNQEGKKSIFGSMFFNAGARNVWEIRKAEESDDNVIHIGLFHTKPPPFSKLHQPLGFQFEFDEEDNRTVVSRHNPEDVEDFVKRMSKSSQIYSLIKSGKMTPADIAEKLGFSANTVRSALLRLKNKNLIVKLGEEYGLLSHPDE